MKAAKMLREPLLNLRLECIWPSVSSFRSLVAMYGTYQRFDILRYVQYRRLSASPCGTFHSLRHIEIERYEVGEVTKND